MNGDRVFGNDLIYIPRNKNEILLATTDANDTRTIDEIWNQLDAYIQQDPYLSKHRGQYAARNGATTPGVTQLDIRIMQDFFINVNGKRNTIQFTLDIFNFGNLLNPEWGVQQTPIRNQLLTFVGQETATGRPVFSFPLDGASRSPNRSETHSPWGRYGRHSLGFVIFLTDKPHRIMKNTSP